MTKTRALLPAVLLAILALSFALAACGGDDGDETATTAPSQEQTTTAEPQENESSAEKGQGSSGGDNPGEDSSPAEGQGSGGGNGGEDEQPASLETDPGKIRNAVVTETGAVQTLPPSEADREEAMENSYSSIKAFGSESEGSEATDITFALLQYLQAKATGDWATACARLYSVLRAKFEEDGKSCAESYGALLQRSSKSAAAEDAKVDVASVRRGEDDRAFVIYKTPTTLSADMPMYLDEGVWTVGAIEAYVLTPEQLPENQQ